ncbi:hypothetical protein, partial [Paenibacillus phytohabitans]|uniref:hypothetical protein n=1 Tax=Paenibacillus phytohabitans TaxID=2654978 RepID=UPI00300BA38E
FSFSFLEVTFVISHSLVVQFSKIKLVVSAAYRVTSNSYNISHPAVQCKLFFSTSFSSSALMFRGQK